MGSRRPVRTARWRVLPSAALSAAVALVSVSAILLPATATAAASGDTSLYLVTLDEPGTSGYVGPLSTADYRMFLRERQDDTLADVGSGVPLYRWTTALSGFAAHLTPPQARDLVADDGVALVERNAVRSLASAPDIALSSLPEGRTSGGAGTVIGVVDSGIWPEGPLFAATPGLGRDAPHFRGVCAPADDWAADRCNRKLVGARWFVAGFGSDNIRSSSSLSPRDDAGHGTQVASVAAGNSGVTVQNSGERMGSYGGVAPQARLSIYKACWTAPDPSDDGCATADLVTAIDRATADGVDVLNLSVGGPGSFDTVERALLGAAEADIAVIAAAGNSGRARFASHVSPWVTTVGGTTSPTPGGEVAITGGPTLAGAMVSRTTVPPARIVRAAQVAAPGSDREDARFCVPGSLDAARVAGTIVLCDRGRLGRTDKSAAVAQADGVAMVLANVTRGPVAGDFHSVPTVHLDADSARTLRAWLRRHPATRASVAPTRVLADRVQMTPLSSGGDPSAGVVKPDLVAQAAGVLGAVPPSVGGLRWDFLSGTSAATARASGAAALLRSRHPWTAAQIRSALTTASTPVPGSPSVLRQGAGRIHPDRALLTGLVFDVDPGDYRAYLDGSLSAGRLNTASILLSGTTRTVTRSVTNLGRRAMYYSSRVAGFSRHQVRVTPAAIRIAPGETTRFRVRVTGDRTTQPLDDGFVIWRGANGSRVRIPVAITR